MWTKSDDSMTPGISRRRGIRGLAAAIALAAPVAGTLVATQQPAAANCDIPADITISDASVVEGTGAGFLQFTLLKFTVNNVANATSVDWKTENGPPPTVPGWSTAIGGSDYTSATGTVQLDGNPKVVHVFVTRDAVHELNEVMSVRLSNPKGCFANIADRSGVGRIYNDD